MECKETNGGIKAIYIMQMPINLESIDFMTELNNDEAKEVKERGGIDCVILSPAIYKIVKNLKEMIVSAEYSAEECFQEIEDEEQGNYYLAQIDAWKEVIKEITGNRPILNEM
jgi:hypothetical protein